MAINTLRYGYCMVIWDRDAWAVWTTNDHLVGRFKTIDEAKAAIARRYCVSVESLKEGS